MLPSPAFSLCSPYLFVFAISLHSSSSASLPLSPPFPSLSFLFFVYLLRSFRAMCRQPPVATASSFLSTFPLTFFKSLYLLLSLIPLLLLSRYNVLFNSSSMVISSNNIFCLLYHFLVTSRTGTSSPLPPPTPPSSLSPRRPGSSLMSRSHGHESSSVPGTCVMRPGTRQ